MALEQILVAFTAGESPALGNIWRITAKRTDFYLDPIGDPGAAVHLSVHGPNDRFGAHGFFLRVDRRAVRRAAGQGNFVRHAIPRRGLALDGHELAPGAFLVARIRWLWDLQRPRFMAAAVSGAAPAIGERQSGARLSKLLAPNDAWDLDVVISYGQPFWPEPFGSLRDNARLGPLRNEAGLWLTATSFRRSQMEDPAPAGLIPRLPRPGEEPNRILCGAPGRDGGGQVYWFVEAITSRQLIEESAASDDSVEHLTRR